MGSRGSPYSEVTAPALPLGSHQCLLPAIVTTPKGKMLTAKRRLVLGFGGRGRVEGWFHSFNI